MMSSPLDTDCRFVFLPVLLESSFERSSNVELNGEESEQQKM